MLKIQYRKTSEIKPYKYNSRNHTQYQVEQVAASITEFGFTNPILIDSKDTIVAGHGRLLAAQHLNIEKVPTIVLGDLSESQREAYVIADNKLALNATWDYELLKSEIEKLTETDFDISLLGFGEVELESILNSELDLSMLDELIDDEADAFEENVKKAIQIEFESGDYEEASELCKKIRAMDAYLGGIVLTALRDATK